MKRSRRILVPYDVRSPVSGDWLLLDRNEGPRPPLSLLRNLKLESSELLRRYPDPGPLESLLASRFGVDPDRVLVTAGADDAIDRCFRAFAGGGGAVVYTVPSFAMLERYAALSGARVEEIEWYGGPFPLERLLARIDRRTALVVLVSPNNPTGATIGPRVLAAVARASCAPVLLDHAYVEYSSVDLTSLALELGNVVVVRTFSKAWGLAGLRVGYVLGSAEAIRKLRAAGGPYPVSSLSLLIASEKVRGGAAQVAKHVKKVRGEREFLAKKLREWKVKVWPSSASFVLGDFGDRASFVRDALAARKILVRDFSSSFGLKGCLRISLPGEKRAFQRLTDVLALILSPDVVLFDLDGVLADVRRSYDWCISRTAREFGVAVGPGQIAAARAKGGANDDWALTRSLLQAGGVEVSLSAVRRRFQRRYLGDSARPGLREKERLLVSRELLEQLAARFKLGIVTGRPGEEAFWFLKRHSVEDLFDVVVAREDAPAKPSSAPVQVAMRRLGASRAWFLGDTPDDMRAASRAGVLGIGVLPPGVDRSTWIQVLKEAGAVWVLKRAGEVRRLLP
ncbi:MAG: hypothetical protein KatS3mg081_0572 [Gemmatimonadales bacterium]|nr:MAG: hypothetical protein KatS3mg081_0572 [Gemmatimonadales bacterium]